MVHFLLIIVTVMLIFALVGRLFNTKQQISKKFNYKYIGRGHIMTKREEKFFRMLNEIFHDKCYVVPQVHLSSLLNHKVKGQNWNAAFSHINGKSVDYVLLRCHDLSVLCAVELDDASHDITCRVERDKEVENIFQSAHIPLVRLRSLENMSKQEIVDCFAKVIKDTQMNEP